MEALDGLRRLAEHCFWADAALLEALRGTPSPPAEAVREYAHIIGTEETWLARLEGRPARTAVWPEAAVNELVPLTTMVGAALRDYLERLTPATLARDVTYRNSAGLTFTNTVGDILFHLMLHGQYHRGKVNLLLRQAGVGPRPADYIAFVRGVPAATTAPLPRGEGSATGTR